MMGQHVLRGVVCRRRSSLLGAALVITQYGLRYMSAVTGALVSIPSTTLMFRVLSPLFLTTGQWHASAVAVFAMVGLFFPAVATMLTFAANQRMGPTMAGTLGGTAPLFAITGRCNRHPSALTAPPLPTRSLAGFGARRAAVREARQSSHGG